MSTRSGLTFGAISTASSPLVAANTSCPANRSVKATKSRISRSSSAIKIFAIESSLLFVDRQREGERTPITRHTRTLHPDPAFMHLHDLFNDGEAQACTGSRQYQRMLTSVESLEHTTLVFQRNTNAVILHIHLDFVAAVQAVDAH